MLVRTPSLLLDPRQQLEVPTVDYLKRKYVAMTAWQQETELRPQKYQDVLKLPRKFPPYIKTYAEPGDILAQ